MEGQGKSSGRPLKRCYQRNRLEDQLWVTAYEYVWPLVRRSLCGSARVERLRDRIAAASRMARRA